MSIEVTALNYYPIKSCAGTAANELEVTETGFRYDRDWMVIDRNDAFMSQRKNPEMALIKPYIDGDNLHVKAPSMEELTVPIEVESGEVELCTVHKKNVFAQPVSSEANEWFSEYFKMAGARLVHVRSDFPRPITDRYRKPKATNKVGFADSFAFLLTSEVSLASLNLHLDEAIPMNRFRPNIVVNGPGLEPYDEDFWREVKIGGMRAFVVRACARCAVPDTEQTTGQRPDRPVTAALKESRHGFDSTDPDLPQGNFFGQNLNHILEPGLTIKVNDAVTVLRRSGERNIAP